MQIFALLVKLFKDQGYFRSVRMCNLKRNDSCNLGGWNSTVRLNLEVHSMQPNLYGMRKTNMHKMLLALRGELFAHEGAGITFVFVFELGKPGRCY